MELKKTDKKDDKIKTFDKRFYISISVFIALVILILFFPFIFIKDSIYSGLDFTKTGSIGDTIGGIMGPFIAIIAAGLTFIAFWVQYQFNREQSKIINDQSIDIRIDRFESKFFELLKIQRENLNNADIQGQHLKEKAFVVLANELRFCYLEVSKIIENKEDDRFKDLLSDPSKILDIAYVLFYFGFSHENIKLSIFSLSPKYPKGIVIQIINELLEKMKTAGDGTKYLPVTIVSDLPVGYRTFQGHFSLLGRYFRHLFNTAKYIANQDERILLEPEKRNYASTLRAQLTDFEQLLLYYNSLTPLGAAWNSPENKFISRFRMIKNIPIPLANFGPVPALYYQSEITQYKLEGKSFFEWDER